MKLEDLEAELRKKLEEIERRKQRLKELEEEEEKLLDELSKLGDFSEGSIVAKYVKGRIRGSKDKMEVYW